jgi:hypothetical protein
MGFQCADIAEGETSFPEVPHEYIQDTELRRSGGYRGILHRKNLKTRPYFLEGRVVHIAVSRQLSAISFFVFLAISKFHTPSAVPQLNENRYILKPQRSPSQLFVKLCQFPQQRQ